MIEVYRYVGLLRRKFQLFLEGGPFKKDLDLRQCERQHLQDCILILSQTKKSLPASVLAPFFDTPHRKVTRITPLLQAPKDTDDEAPPAKTDAGTGGGYAGASSQVWPLDSPRLARGINKRGKSDTPFLSESLSNFSRWV